ncbi:hypothetical protein MJG53_009459 [Ovis ammon polii x Ovis aries]|uniref:Uncharacterized protein n=1 Tax=Ovis ammon polii x Ovis aries TaxID=2918886 RepID=A0ACB9UX49_9CETA|nr:hypothetical protein MJG53_009459 [Ovis ammon polii x Ovis aries]
MLVPPSGIEPSTPALEGKVLATGPSGKSLEIHDEEQKPRGQCDAGEDEGTLGPGNFKRSLKAIKPDAISFGNVLGNTLLEIVSWFDGNQRSSGSRVHYSGESGPVQTKSPGYQNAPPETPKWMQRRAPPNSKETRERTCFTTLRFGLSGLVIRKASKLLKEMIRIFYAGEISGIGGDPEDLVTQRTESTYYPQHRQKPVIERDICVYAAKRKKYCNANFESNFKIVYEENV